MNGVEQLYPDTPLQKGVATITKFEFKNERDPLYNLRMARDGHYEWRVRDGKYVRLHIGKELMMTDTHMERFTNMAFVARATGRVLIAGLGVGLILQAILEKDDVKEIVIIEKYQDVIDLVAPLFPDPRIKIICADIFEWAPAKGELFDTIYFDIWPSMDSEKNLADIRKLHSRFKYKLNRANPVCWMDSWQKRYLQNEVAKERRLRYYW